VLAAGALLALGEGAAGPRAAVLVAAACVCWALDNHWTALLDGVPATASAFWKGAVAGTVNLGLGLAAAPWDAPARTALLALGVGAASYGVSLVLYIVAAHGLGATRAQLFFAAGPFFGVALALPVLGERPDAAQLGAAALFAASLGLVLRDRHAHPHRHEALAHTHVHGHDDGHHLHAHPGQPASLQHSHWHEHEPLEHAHPHVPDLHHRHVH
jgi:drug/metabolite transporter (DMT)-like permease